MDDVIPGGTVIMVEVVYADAERQIARRLQLPAGSTVADAISASRLEHTLPAGVIDRTRLGIFAQRVSADQPLCHGDRVEIYRPLALDPMEARRRRARRR